MLDNNDGSNLWKVVLVGVLCLNIFVVYKFTPLLKALENGSIVINSSNFDNDDDVMENDFDSDDKSLYEDEYFESLVDDKVNEIINDVVDEKVNEVIDEKIYDVVNEVVSKKSNNTFNDYEFDNRVKGVIDDYDDDASRQRDKDREFQEKFDKALEDKQRNSFNGLGWWVYG